MLLISRARARDTSASFGSVSRKTRRSGRIDAICSPVRACVSLRMSMPTALATIKAGSARAATGLGLGRVEAKITTAASATMTPAMTSVSFRFRMLFIPESHNGIETRSALRRVDAKEDSDRGGKAHRHHQRPGRDERRPTRQR